MTAEPESQEPERDPIVLSRASADLYEEVSALCECWDDIGVLVDRREGAGKYGFIVPRDGGPEPVPDLPEIP